MKKIMSLIISVLFMLSVSGLCFAQAAAPAPSDEKPAVSDQQPEKKTKKTKKAKKSKKSKKSSKSKKADQEKAAPAEGE